MNRLDDDLLVQRSSGEKFDQQRNRRKQLNIRIVEIQLDENGSCGLIDPLMLMQGREIRLEILQTTPKLVQVSFVAEWILTMFTGNALMSLHRRRLISKRFLQRLVGYGVRPIAPAELERVGFFIVGIIIVIAESLKCRNGTGRRSNTVLSHQCPADVTVDSVIQIATQMDGRIIVVPRLGAEFRDKVFLQPRPKVIDTSHRSTGQIRFEVLNFVERMRTGRRMDEETDQSQTADRQEKFSEKGSHLKFHQPMFTSPLQFRRI